MPQSKIVNMYLPQLCFKQGAFWGMIGGFVCGVIRMCLDWSRAVPPCGSSEPDNRFSIIAQVHYLHFAAILAVITSIIITIVSLMTKPRPQNKVRDMEISS